jgi:hypothetical protein
MISMARYGIRRGVAAGAVLRSGRSATLDSLMMESTPANAYQVKITSL